MKLVIIMLLTFLLVGIAECDRYEDGPDIKIYVSKPEEGGIVRKQAQQEDQIILYKDTKDYKCISKKDFDILLAWCLDPGKEE